MTVPNLHPIQLDSSVLRRSTTMTNLHSTAHLPSTRPRSFSSARVEPFSTICPFGGLPCWVQSLECKRPSPSTFNTDNFMPCLRIVCIWAHNFNKTNQLAKISIERHIKDANVSWYFTKPWNSFSWLMRPFPIKIRCAVPPSWRQMSTKVSSMTKRHPHARFAPHAFIREGDDVVVARSRQEKDVLVDCLFWRSLPRWCVTIHKTINFSGNDEILCHEGVWQYPLMDISTGDLAFSQHDEIYGFKFPKRFLEISPRDLTLFTLYSILII